MSSVHTSTQATGIWLLTYRAIFCLYFQGRRGPRCWKGNICSSVSWYFSRLDWDYIHKKDFFLMWPSVLPITVENCEILRWKLNGWLPQVPAGSCLGVKCSGKVISSILRKGEEHKLHIRVFYSVHLKVYFSTTTMQEKDFSQEIRPLCKSVCVWVCVWL